MKNLIQNKNSHKFSTDALLLAELTPLEKVNIFAELGTGCGIISLELLKRKENLKGIAIDFNEDLLTTAQENAKIYKVENKIDFILENLENIKENIALKKYCNTVDLIVCNPPWLLENQGKLPKEEMKKNALFGNKDTYTLFFNAGKYLLKERGLLSFISIPSRLEDIINSLGKTGFVLKKMLFVHKNKDSNAIFVFGLAEFRGKSAKDCISDMVLLAPKFLE